MKKVDQTSILDEQSPTPLYHQLYKLFREKIERGDWKENDKIPTEIDLSNQYKISRGTVSQALKLLESEGILYRKQGRGTFVTEKKINLDLSHFYSFVVDMKARGKEFFSKVLSMSMETPTASILKRLNLSSNERVFKIVRLRYAEKMPVILETIHLLPGYEGLSQNKEAIEEEAIYQLLLEKHGVIVKGAREVFEVVRMNDYETNLFGVEESFPALMVERLTTDTNAKPFEYRKSIVRADQVRYTVELKT